MSISGFVGSWARAGVIGLGLVLAAGTPALAQVAIKGGVVHTMGPAGSIERGVVVITDGKIAAVGPAAGTAIPAGYRVIEAAVVTPGLVDPHGTVGLSGIFNQRHDSDQLEHSSPVQPELRALDAYNPLEPLVEWLRSFGVTTVNTGHAWGELISGQTIVVKTAGKTVEEALLKNPGSVAATLSPLAEKDGAKAPGNRAKMMAMLREQFVKAGEYQARQQKWAAAKARGEEPKPAEGAGEQGGKAGKADAGGPPARDLKMEMLVAVLKGEVPLMVTANRAQDIASVLRLAEEFKIRVILDSAAEAYLLTDRIKAAGVSVVLHPQLVRYFGEFENASFETAATLKKAGIPLAIQSGYEPYVPKTRVVLLEAATAAANGLSFAEALATITIDAARVLGVEARVGSLEVGKDADAALYDGDPFEYTSHCVGTLINGRVVFEGKR
jgi:imidazolonepropionase-like amidohydrolase